jgi:hypothetical protein
VLPLIRRFGGRFCSDVSYSGGWFLTMFCRLVPVATVSIRLAMLFYLNIALPPLMRAAMVVDAVCAWAVRFVLSPPGPSIFSFAFFPLWFRRMVLVGRAAGRCCSVSASVGFCGACLDGQYIYALCVAALRALLLIQVCWRADLSDVCVQFM